MNELSNRGTAFAEAACKLLIEYSNRLALKRHELASIVEQSNDVELGSRPYKTKHYLRNRWMIERDDFALSKKVYETLIRKASQWIEHGEGANPGLELELQVRLADFEAMVRSMDGFIQSNDLM